MGKMGPSERTSDPSPASAFRHPRERGVSLLEVMMAVAILSVVMMAVLTMVLISLATLQAAREQEIAKEAAMAQIATLRMGGFSTVPASQGKSFTVDGLSDPQQADRKARGSVSIDSSNPNLIAILVTVTWKGPKGRSAYSMRSLCAP